MKEIIENFTVGDNGIKICVEITKNYQKSDSDVALEPYGREWFDHDLRRIKQELEDTIEDIDQMYQWKIDGFISH